MNTGHALRRLPGVIALLLVTGMTTAAAVTGTASFFYEAWGQPWSHLPPYLLPTAGLMAAGLVALRWPRAGGVLLLAAAACAGGYWLNMQLGRGMASFDSLIFQAAVMTTPVILAGLLFLLEARHRRLLRQEGAPVSPGRLVRCWRSALLVMVPLCAMAALAVQQVPALLARHDDGLRGARRIASGSTTLIWAPQGPGWNRLEPDGRYPGWNALVRHGRLARERCSYLNEEGTALVDEPIGRWRMPTAHEIIGALSRGGQSAGCTWDGRSPHASCRTAPDKETPLWAPDQAPIYYWSGQEATAGSAFAVNYTGGISVLPTASGELGVGFRCVKAAGDGR